MVSLGNHLEKKNCFHEHVAAVVQSSSLRIHSPSQKQNKFYALTWKFSLSFAAFISIKHTLIAKHNTCTHPKVLRSSAMVKICALGTHKASECISKNSSRVNTRKNAAKKTRQKWKKKPARRTPRGEQRSGKIMQSSVARADLLRIWKICFRYEWTLAIWPWTHRSTVSRLLSAVRARIVVVVCIEKNICSAKAFPERGINNLSRRCACK